MSVNVSADEEHVVARLAFTDWQWNAPHRVMPHSFRDEMKAYAAAGCRTRTWRDEARSVWVVEVYRA